VKVVRSALRIPLALGERAGVRETVMAAATYILRGGADVMAVTVKVVRSALRIPLALGERAGVRETVMAAATYILRGGADVMAVR
jgi:hypothetical protein